MDYCRWMILHRIYFEIRIGAGKAVAGVRRV
jgi:hypothetical protein